ncbi:MAG: HAD hydrolase-like protein [Smithellaceae bacterium]|nr:HAD hydrolase-like protein [Smithellaceae bacterium]
MSADKFSPLEIEAVIFDFDGTLGHLNIDFPLMRRRILDLSGEYGVNLNGREGRYVLELISSLKDDIGGHDDNRAREFYDRAMEIVASIEITAARKGELIPGTIELLEEFRRRGIKLGVVTRNCLAAVSLILPGIGDYFGGAVITRERTINFKPHPEHLQIALHHLSTGPEKSAMVGDHPMDILVGKSVGTTNIGVLTGYSTREELEAAGADHILAKAADLAGLL